MSKKHVRGPVINVDVLQPEIDEAFKKDSSHCVVAEAIKKMVPWAKSVSVDVQTIRMTDQKKGLRYTFLTPRPVQVMIVQFDEGKKVKPFSFDLRRAHVTACKGGAEKARKAGVPQQATLLADGGNPNHVPRRIGGRPPPSTPYLGRRREFGLRALGARPDGWEQTAPPPSQDGAT